MATNILMPALSPTMTEGTLARWLKKEGEAIKAGDVIAEIETDKATMEVEAVDEGVLGKILVPGGTEGVKVNEVIAVLVAPGEAVPGGPAPAAPKPASAPAPVPAAAPASTPAAPAAAPAGNRDRVFASPLARRMAQQAGLDLTTVTGSGPQGRIVKADVEAAMNRPAAPTRAAAPVTVAAVAPAPVAAPAPRPAPSAARAAIAAPHEAVPHSTMRKVISRRLSESKASIPHFYVAMDIELDALLKLRAELNAQAPKEGPGAFRLSVNDLIIKACAVALRRHPGVNASWTEEAILRFSDVDISVAVAIPEGLITPIVKRADQKGLATISNEMKDLAARAKAGRLKPEEFQGGGFSISNMGMYGVSHFAAIINPPQAGILAVGAGEQRPVVKNGALAIATVMTCQLSVDHRVIDGALAAEFMQTLKGLIENPLSLML
ncbi:pyruvate dehydrogenase complex dihydrolipoamide acetyltransferase [Rubritepida flocculans]|uniref:pyruvate dehydrogenase complex dihydrolipoamide acetyltransferase n=1 Tax=Rubritepida flocculans TaxID=182403 RepID=UPI0004140180|nr:pyruvate dehydrogenase complex dihydrolipoamide acetyltransferase [Rubritepida flocculans]